MFRRVALTLLFVPSLATAQSAPTSYIYDTTTNSTSTSTNTNNNNNTSTSTSTNTNVNQNNNVNLSDSKSTSYSENVSRQVIDQNLKSPPPTAALPVY